MKCTALCLVFLQLNGPGAIHSGQQLSSPVQLQERHESSYDDRHRASATSSNDIKPLLSSVGQASGVSVGEASGTQKVSPFIIIIILR